MNTGCQRARDLLLERDRLDATETAWLDGHLDACAACRDEARVVAEFGDFVAAATVDLPEDFADGVMAAVRPRPTGVPRWLWLAGVGLTGALVLVRPGAWADLAAGWTAAAAGSSAAMRAVADWCATQGTGVSFTVREMVPAMSLNGSLVAAMTLVLLAAGLITIHQSSREVHQCAKR